MPFAKGKPRAANAGRRRGTRNKRTVAAQGPVYPDALKHLAEVMASTDGAITPELKLRAALGLAPYQNSKPVPLKTFQPIELKEPTTAQEARDAIVRITMMIAKGEVDGEHGGRIIAGLEAFLSAKAAENEKRIQALEAALRGET